MNYDKTPIIPVDGCENQGFSGYSTIMERIRQDMAGKTKVVVTLDCYHGVYDEEVLPAFISGLSPVLVINMKELMKPQEEIFSMLKDNITDDRVFGIMYHGTIDKFIDLEKIEAAKKKVSEITDGVVLLYGIGAACVSPGDILVYADMSRWEIQQRFRRNEISNWCADNYEEDPIRQIKRGFFIDWRVIDRHKKALFDRIDYLLDTNHKNEPNMITGNSFRKGLSIAAHRPFRVVPYFDPGVWGGQWMKEVCGLDPTQKNFAWCFDGVPEENSLLLQVDGVIAEIPSIDLVFRHPIELLGDKVHARFGTEFPIRFDFLDTMDGGNLSLQVHPLTEYIQDTFGMHYTQDESYYMLDAAPDASVYLGVKKGVEPEALISALKEAQETGEFEAEKFINNFPAKKHDHFLIPAGTIHCSGRNGMVLEISATPYIFTFKLWDWGRLGLDGRPRPVHIDHGSRNIQYNRDTDWVTKNLINRVEEIGTGDGWREERTGLHEREFIETRRHWFTKTVHHNTNGGVNVLNLVEGSKALVESPSGAFPPFEVHYAETFIIPASVGEYTISPCEDSNGEQLATIKAYVRC